MSKRSRLITSASPGQTAASARHIGRHIPPGAVIAAYGDFRNRQDLFRGRTGAGYGNRRDHRQPRLCLFPHLSGGDPSGAHIDACRLEGLSEEEIALTGIEDCFAAGNVAFSVEWPGFISPWLPQSTVELHLERGATDTERILEFVCGPKDQRWLDEASSY